MNQGRHLAVCTLSTLDELCEIDAAASQSGTGSEKFPGASNCLLFLEQPKPVAVSIVSAGMARYLDFAAALIRQENKAEIGLALASGTETRIPDFRSRGGFRKSRPRRGFIIVAPGVPWF